MAYYVYILRCADATLYTGITTDLQKRLHAHNHLKSGAKYTKNRRPVSLAYHEICEDRCSALKREYAIKKLNRDAKESLIGV